MSVFRFGIRARGEVSALILRPARMVQCCARILGVSWVLGRCLHFWACDLKRYDLHACHWSRCVWSGGMRTSEVENDTTMDDASVQAAPIAHIHANPLVISPGTHQPTPMRAIDLYSGEEDNVTREVTMADIAA